MRVHDFFESKIKGADGKACWKGYRYNGTKDGKDSCVKVDEARADVNFDAEDLKRLERINDLETLKTQAFGLISKPSAKPMKPEKVAWFKQALASKSNKIAVIKMMYDLMLSGEGNSVIGSKNSMNPNSYRKVFNSATMESAESLSIGDDVIITGNVEFNGKTGVIDSFGKDKRFVVVNLYNHGRHSFHSSDVSVNDYADSDEEESRMSEAYQNDEANLWYIYDKTDGRLKQKMIANLDEPQARQMGYRDSIDAALRVVNIIRSKFDAKKFVQKQGNQWVPVYPFGKPGMSETAMDPRLQKYIDNNPEEVSDSIDTLRDRANAEGGRFKWAIGKLPDGRFVLGLQGNIKMLGLPIVDQGISEASSPAEGSQRVDSLVTKGLKIMRGPTRDDAIAALKYQVGERDFNERRGFYNFYVRQLMDMYGKKDVAEGKKRSDRYHIVGKDGNPASLASYADQASAVKDRDEKHPGAEVRQVGPRGKVKGVSEGAEQMTPNWAKYVLDQIYNSNGEVSLTDLFDEGIPGLHAMFMDTAQKHGFDPEEDFEDVQHELALELEDLIKGGHDMDEAYSSPPPFKDMIASVYQPKVGDKIRTRKGGQIPGTVEKVGEVNGIDYCWFRHPEGKLYKTPCSNVMRD
jgi:hypothetical protein